jgi:signal transduction histidine kinase/DNA-binding response OmpR family regulator
MKSHSQNFLVALIAKFRASHFCLILIVLLLGSCSEKKKVDIYKIGFSQCQEDDWRNAMLADMKRELSFHNNIDFFYKEATGSSTKQVEQIEDLIKKHIDLLIVSPNEAQPLTPIIEKAFDAGIKVVIVDRRINSQKYTAFIGASNYDVGQNAAKYAMNTLNNKGNVLELMGLAAASPFIDRHKGFIDLISQSKNITLLKTIKDHTQSYQQELTETIRNNNVDFVFAHSDYMARDLVNFCKKAGIKKNFKIIGVDGLSVDSLGMDMVMNRSITATILYPTGGQEAMLTAINILENKPFSKENQLATTIIDSSNVRIMKLQSQKLLNQQIQIEQGQQVIDKQNRITQNQHTVIFLILLALIVTIILGGVSFYYMNSNRKIAAKLEKQNIEILDQKNQLIEMSDKAEAAHQAKLNFFTNISHEFRTPLTLILSPLEDLLSNPKLSPLYKQTLQLVQKNVIRLYRLVNQLMDFRKIELNKMQLHVSNNDLVAFTKEIFDSFQTLAKNKNISFQFFTSEKQLFIWLDVTMIDKVVFNLLSNAFKFTKENGFIYVNINKINDRAVIKIEDNGIGMSEDSLQHAFDPFFQGEYENYKGTGLGLALSKELIELHKGNITVKSEKWKGTTFEIDLPIDDGDFNKNQTAFEIKANSLIKEDAQIYISELYDKQYYTEADDNNVNNDKKCILIIEDNNDLRNYLKSKLKGSYDIIDADNSNTALQLLFDYIPDLVICDVVIPGKTGIEVTNVIKNDVRTSHIPVILVTARNEEAQSIQGLKAGADSYISKPFSLTFLEQTINTLLYNREKTKNHFTGNVINEDKGIAVKKAERKFISTFSAIVENNISNENFSVENICMELRISRVQLYRKVKQLLNCSVNEYIIDVRLQKAKYYLQHEDLSISEIAFRTGFSSSAYFSTTFKATFGVTPKEFKQKNKNEKINS